VDNLAHHAQDVQALAKLVGCSPALLRTNEQLPVMARSKALLLIVGETGTGKEPVAWAIHYLSNREAFPFVPVNCGALSETLFEDELFGHAPGAFTDARVRREGLIAHAEGAMLLLDEMDTLAVTRRDLFREFSQENPGYFVELDPARVAFGCLATMGQQVMLTRDAIMCSCPSPEPDNAPVREVGCSDK